MPTISEQFAQLREKQELGLMTHVVCGFPSLDMTEPLVQTMEAAGADFIELQIPFSDPSADGPTMIGANTRALEQGITVAQCFALAAKLSAVCTAPLIFMTYLNILFNHGIERFVLDATKVGIKAIIVPDLPVEESDEYCAACAKAGIDPIFVVSPNISDERLQKIAKVARGFLYCTTRTGTTGVQEALPTDSQAYLARLRRFIDLPLAVGFGIAKPEHVQALRGHADCAIVGSAVINLLQREGAKEDQLERVHQFVQTLKLRGKNS